MIFILFTFFVYVRTVPLEYLKWQHVFTPQDLDAPIFFKLFITFNHKSKTKTNRMITSLNDWIFQRLSNDFLNLYDFMYVFILESF